MITTIKNKMKIKKIVFLSMFFVIFVLPHYAQYKKFGPKFSGDLNLASSSRISTFNETFNYVVLNYSDSLILLNNPIVIFFVVAFFFQKILSLV